MKKVLIFSLFGVLIAGLLTLLIRPEEASKPYSLEEAFNQKIEGKRKGVTGNKQMKIEHYKKMVQRMKIPFGEDKFPAPAGYLYQELKKVRSAKDKVLDENINWIERGPANVGGRTRGLIIDPDDPTHNTWFAGCASGGMWKTTDGGKDWRCLTSDLPYQTTTTLAMAKSNSNVIYMGTGESFAFITGGGMFRSIDKGESWEYLESTFDNENFRYINRIVIDPDNDSIVVAATTTGIYKSINAGETWTEKYRSANSVGDLVADTSDFNYQFAGVTSLGIVRSVDGGETWVKSSTGLGEKIRIELAISPTNSDKIYASVETSDEIGALYSSWDRGITWEKVVNSEDDNYSFHGGQGDYDNTIAVHPYDENIVFFGGVNLWLADVGDVLQTGDAAVSAVDTFGTSSFLDFIPFTGNLYNGMNTGDMEEATNLEEGDFASVEIRFGPGLSQKAHRFFVPEEATSGVAAADYTYQDYVDVPFEVWDITNDRQLMCSFRDQERDGSFNLYQRTGDDYGDLGREYLFINAVDYDAENADPNIAVQAGRSYKLIYFFWPTLIENGAWDSENLPESKILVEWSIIQERVSDISNVADAYGQYGGINNVSFAGTNILGLHPDHHELNMIPINDDTEEFWVLNANDGGLGISKDNGVHFSQLHRNLNTTQFYGVGKKPYRNEFIGGMQDNGTWQSPINIESTIDTAFTLRIGGDGIEALWHQQDSNRLMGSTQFGPIFRSLDHGLTWNQADNGVTGLPFQVKLSPVPSKNNMIFTTATGGVYKTGNFGTTNWRLAVIEEGWLGIGFTEVTSLHQVEVSPANEQIVWAGAGMIDDLNWSVFVSTDQGDNFVAVNNPVNEVRGFMSSFATHPTEENTAYALYSIYGDPKILRTEDLGETWEDITQVDGEGVSANGFPNVGVNSLFVFPETPDTIWAGTEIGIMQSVDNGESWEYLETNLPAVNIWQMYAQDNAVVVATYGRGIWTWQYGPELEPPVDPVDNINSSSALESNFRIYPNPSNGIFNVVLDDLETGISGIEVYSINGTKIYGKTVDHYDNEEYVIDLSDQVKGIYMLNVITKNKRYSQRIILR